MTFRLNSFQYLPRSNDGWESRKLLFGAMLTAVQAPNGAGKTPIMKGIAATLGHEIELPPQIVERCLYAQLEVTIEGTPYTLTRTLGVEFELLVSNGVERLDFTSQTQYAQWFINQFAQQPPTLTTKQAKEGILYASTLLPALWVDQDRGWTVDYWVPSNRNFLLDQRQEVIRFLVGMPPRHPFRSRDALDKAKRDLDRTTRALELQRFIVDRLARSMTAAPGDEATLVEAQQRLRIELTANSGAIEAIRTTATRHDRRISDLETEQSSLIYRKRALLRRSEHLAQVTSELAGEEDILSANTLASDLMRQFCGRQGCQMFQSSERSFGRSLLFLRDQIKDLKFSGQAVADELNAVEIKLEGVSESIVVSKRERDLAVNASPHEEVIGKINALTSDLVETELKLARVQQYNSEALKFEKLIDRRQQESAIVEEARLTGGGARTSTSDAKTMLSDSLQRWLIALGTKNTKDAHFDDSLTLHVNGEKFSATSHQSGSTRTRIVLAFHAALLEVSLQRGGNHPGWILFDAPKQHELSQSDFDNYMERLQVLATTYPGRVQIVFSAADIKTQFQAGDEVWHPTFTMDGEARFLGSTS